MMPLAADQSRESRSEGWRSAALALLAVRFVQGWIFWGGGSRRFIYAPSKLDPTAHEWMASKFQSAMPGALLGMDRVVDFMLHHFSLLYAGVVVFSAAELIFGLFLIIGFMTRLSALVTVGFSVILMLLFGWQGATCLDEWTMAACNCAMGVTLFIAGSSAYSVDSWLMHCRPSLGATAWFRWGGSGLWAPRDVRRLGVTGAILTALFVVLTYDHYRGSVVTAFHAAPVSPSEHHFSLSDGSLTADGAVRVTAYLDGGTPETPANIVRIDLVTSDNHVAETWNSATLAALPKSIYNNDYRYNQFGPGYAGITARMGARATISLPPVSAGLIVADAPYTLLIHSVDGRAFCVALHR
jgi:thiosulfate dehydrogenase [quinone] large subunit